MSECGCLQMLLGSECVFRLRLWTRVCLTAAVDAACHERTGARVGCDLARVYEEGEGDRFSLFVRVLYVRVHVKCVR